jgi:hypothetical protein
MKKRSIIVSIALILLVCAFVLSSCGGSDSTAAEPANAPAAQEVEPTRAPETVENTSVPEMAPTPEGNTEENGQNNQDSQATPAANSGETANPPAPAGGNSAADLGFRPDQNGFPFENYGGGNYVNLDESDMNRMFGDVVCANKTDGKCTLIPSGSQWMQQMNDAMAGGHCYGMAQASLLFYQGKLNPSDFGAPSMKEMKLDGNDKLQHEIAYDWVGQVLDKVVQGEVKGTPNEVLDRIIQAFKEGKAGEVYVAGFYKADGNGGHAVTPYAVEDRGNGIFALMVYDNNYPGQPREVLFDRNKNSWSYEASTNPQEESELYTGDAETKTFSFSPVSPAVQVSPCPFCEGGGTAGKTPGHALAAEGENEVYLDGPADLLIRDEKGNRLGKVDGKIVNEIPGASYEVLMTGYNSNQEPVYYIPASVNLIITVDGTKLKEQASTDVVVIGPGYDLGVEGIILDPGQKDELAIESKDNFISYLTDSPESPNFILGTERKGVYYEFELQGTDIEGGGAVSLMIDPKTGDLQVNADDLLKDGKFYLAMTRIDDKTEETFENDEITLKSGAVLYVDFSEWKGNGTPLFMGIDTNNDGEFEEEYESTDEK